MFLYLARDDDTLIAVELSRSIRTGNRLAA